MEILPIKMNFSGGGTSVSVGSGICYIQAGAHAGIGIEIDIGLMNTKELGIEKSKVHILTQTACSDSMKAIKGAIEKVSVQRSRLGAYQNRLEHTIRSLDNTVENTTAAESRIRDTDMAKEMITLANNNIIMQAAQAMLAQANQKPQGVLQLLQ